MSSTGHLFIIDGDIKRLACDAWLLPTNPAFFITQTFCEAVGLNQAGRLWTAAWDGWQGAGCVLHRASSGPSDPDLWLGDVGRTAVTPNEHFVQRAEEFVAASAARVRRRTDIGGRRPLVALPVLGTGEGGKRALRGDVLRLLVPGLARAAQRERCDVALVVYGSVMYAAAQSVRRSLENELDFWAAIPPDFRTIGDGLADRAERGELVLFLGAGVSRNAGIPVWRDLLKHLAEHLGKGPDWYESVQGLDPRDQASLLNSVDPAGFRAAVHEVMRKERYSLMHGLLASLPINEAVTTNFDELFELAARASGRSLSVIPGGTVRPGEHWILKLHGTIGRDLVFTRSEYLGSLSTHAALRGLVQAMLLTRYMLFVGYSLGDEDFHHLMHEVRFALGSGKQPELGLVLTPLAPSPAEQLWPELDFATFSAMPDGSLREVDEAVRLIAVFLDYVGSRAASEIRFIADDSLGVLKTEDEVLLAEIVEKLEGLVAKAPTDGWHEIRQFLKHFLTDGV